MIVPMKKVSIIMVASQKEKALKKLRSLGLLQIEITEHQSYRLEDIKSKIALVENAIYALNEISDKNRNVTQKSADCQKVVSTAQKIETMLSDKVRLQSEISTLKSELERISYWGEINPDDFTELSENGIKITLCEMPLGEYKTLDDNIKTIVLEKSKTVRFAVVGSDTDALQNYIVKLPVESTSQIRQKTDDFDLKIKAIDEKLKRYLSYLDAMKDALKQLEKDAEFEFYLSGMESETVSENKDAAIVHFDGYIPAEDIAALKSAASENSWAMVSDDPTAEDDVPTKLKNNKLISLIYPLTDFLGTVPGYFEYDISGWFLGFILIFFGIIFGDGGYGLIITGVAAALMIKSYISKKEILPAYILIALMGGATILWGTLTCTWFGMDAASLPQWLQNISVPFISNVYGDKIWYPFWTSGKAGLTTAQNIQILCFSLALVQLTVAHIKGTVRNIKSMKALGDIGSIMQLLGIFYIVLSLVVNGDVFGFGLVLYGIPIGTVALCLIGIGFVMSFVFSNYEDSILKSICESLKNIVSVLLGVVNLFSDIVSYIRLWAVGLAGAAISATVNELAGPMMGKFTLMIFAIIILIFGHGLNLILNVLSVIVHGIRLNTLEFSSHLDMSWSGHKFKPFEE